MEGEMGHIKCITGSCWKKRPVESYIGTKMWWSFKCNMRIWTGCSCLRKEKQRRLAGRTTIKFRFL